VSLRRRPPAVVSAHVPGTTVYGGTAAPGTYTIEISPSDNSGNITVDKRTVNVSGKKLVPKTLRALSVPVGPSPRPTSTAAPGCSRLRRPSLRGWTGSVGYYSNTRCSRGFDASVAATANGINVPKAFQNGPTVSAARFVHDKSTDPFVIWSAMTAVGHRYDIRDFTVVLTYTVLE
jgi:hypothetical protein